VHSHSGLVTSPAAYAGPRALKTTFAVEAGPYLIQTPDSGVVLGPYPKALFGNRIIKPDQVYGIDDDSFVRPEVKRWLADYCRDSYLGWGKEADGEGLTKCWTGEADCELQLTAGIICHSVDYLPIVGAVPGRPGVWIAAGYNGRGMALIHSVTRGLAHQLKTGQWDERVPRAFEVSEARIKRAKERALHPLDYPLTGLEYRTMEKSKM
jgi:glycine/D-amino acid oxidase-like deaminating enzyme